MLSLKVKKRNIIGRKKVEKLREAGKLPGVVYGPKTENQAIVLDYKDFEKLYDEAGGAPIVNLELAEQKIPVLIKQTVRHPVTSKFLHIDFYAPKLEEKIIVTIPLAFEGEAPGVKELEAILVKNISEIEIKALPQYLIQEILVHVFSLKTFDDVIQVKDLKVPSEVEILKDPEEAVAQLARPKQEVVEKPAQQEVEAGAEEKKPEEEGQSKQESETKSESKEQGK